MQKSLLITVLEALPPDSFRKLGQFVQSPFHNQREDVVLLYQFIAERLHIRRNELTKKEGFQFVYPDEPYDDQKMRYLMSFLLKSTERMLAISSFLKNDSDVQWRLMESYRQLNLGKAFRTATKKAFPWEKQEKPSSPEAYEAKYRFEFEKYAFSEKQGRDIPHNLQILDSTLDKAFIAKKLRQAGMLLSHQAVFKTDYDTGLLREVLEHLETAPWLQEEPLIHLYFLYFKALSGNDGERYFNTFKNLLFHSAKAVDFEENRNLHLLAINYGIRKFNEGEEKWVREVFDLYKSALEKDVLLEDGKISRFAFKNIVGIALRQNEHEWLEKFIGTYGPLLGTEHQQTYIHYSLSKLAYSRRNYREAMERLLQVEYEDIFLNLDGKVMLMKMYFELSEWEALDSFLSSFRRFLHRKKEVGYHRDNYLNIISFVHKMTHLDLLEKENLKQLRKEIETTPAVAEREWLLGQLEKISR